METVEIIVGLLFVVTCLGIIANRVTTPYPILFVLGGCMLALFRGLPHVVLSPDVVFFLFLPPLLYAAAWFTPWNSFIANIRPISLLAVGLVIVTTAVVGCLTHWLIPDIPLAACFVLGAIVSPPDAISATAITQRLKVPKRIVTIIEGESLVNDATGLVLYKFAIAAVVTGTFSWIDAATQFLWVAAAGVTVGLIVGWVIYRIHLYLKDPLLEITFSLLAPYVSYLPAEKLHVSGVLAVVTSGLFVSLRAHRTMSSLTRIKALAVWEILTFILNGVIFILIGLQLHEIYCSVCQERLSQLLTHTGLIALSVILVRILYVYTGAIIPRMIPSVRKKDPYPGWRPLLLLGWTGMRGVVSLAAAMSLPLFLQSGEPFPGRDYILFISFGVILITLVGQGLTLPGVIRGLKLIEDHHSEKHHENSVRANLAQVALSHIHEKAEKENVPEEAANALRTHYQQKLVLLGDKATEILGWSPMRHVFLSQRALRRSAIKIEREELLRLHKEGQVEDELLHKLEHELDLEELRLHN